MNNVPDSFAPFLASIAPPGIRPVKYQCRHLRRTPGTQTFRHTLAGVDLVCEIEWEAAERGTRDEPGSPANAILYSAVTSSGDDITEILSLEQQGEIEEAFLNQKEEY